MNAINSIIVLLLVIYSHSAIAEPEFAVTQEGESFLFDYLSAPNSNITALGFRIDIGDIDPAAIDLSNCTAGLPSTHIGFCNANPGFIKVLVYSNDSSILGTTHIGSINVDRAAIGSRGDRRTALSARRGNSELAREAILNGNKSARFGLDQIKVRNLNYSDVEANDISGEVLQ